MAGAAQMRRRVVQHEGGEGGRARLSRGRGLDFIPGGARGLRTKHGCNLSHAGLCVFN